MQDREPLRYQHARKVAGQYTGYRGLSGMRMTRPGAYFFFSPDFGALTIVDEIALSKADRRLLAPYLKPLSSVHRETGVMEHNSQKRAPVFRTARDLDTEQELPSGCARVDIWQFAWGAWCLPHIFAGLTTKGHTDREALREFDLRYATSAHDRIRARQIIQDRGEAQ